MDKHSGGIFDWLSKYSRVNIDSSVNLSWNWPTWKKLFETYENMLQRLSSYLHSPDKNDDDELFSTVRNLSPEKVRMSLDDLSKFNIWHISCFNNFRVATFCLFIWLMLRSIYMSQKCWLKTNYLWNIIL